MKTELFLPLNGWDCKGTVKEIEFILAWRAVNISDLSFCLFYGTSEFALFSLV